MKKFFTFGLQKADFKISKLLRLWGLLGIAYCLWYWRYEYSMYFAPAKFQPDVNFPGDLLWAPLWFVFVSFYFLPATYLVIVALLRLQKFLDSPRSKSDLKLDQHWAAIAIWLVAAVTVPFIVPFLPYFLAFWSAVVFMVASSTVRRRSWRRAAKVSELP